MIDDNLHLSVPKINEASACWPVVLLDSVAIRGSGHTPNKKHAEYWGGSIDWVSLKDTSKLDRGLISATAETITRAGLAHSSAVLHKRGTVILLRDAGIGKSAVLGSDMAVSQHFLAWNCGPSLYNWFLYYWFQFMKNEFERISNGSTIKTIGLGYFRQLQIPLPDQYQQRQIANILADADTQIEALERSISKKQAIRQGVMYQLLTGNTRLPGFTGEWLRASWGDVTERCTSGATPLRSRADFYEGSIPWVTSTELKYGTVTKIPQHITAAGMKAANLTLWPQGTFLMAITGLEAAGTRGSCGILGIPATTNQSCMAVVPNQRLRSDFLYYHYLLRGEELALRYCQGTKQQSYTAAIVKTLPIYLPVDIAEQQSIAAALTDIDFEIETLRARFVKAKAVKEGMMQQLLVGRTRLPVKETVS